MLCDVNSVGIAQIRSTGTVGFFSELALPCLNARQQRTVDQLVEVDSWHCLGNEYRDLYAQYYAAGSSALSVKRSLAAADSYRHIRALLGTKIRTRSSMSERVTAVS